MMQICSELWSLKTWQVKTMCPLGWSDEEGDGMDVCPLEDEMDVGMAVEKLNAGVVIGCVASGASTNEGVEA